MNRESVERFAEVPEANIMRSKFKRPFTHKTTMTTGNIYPIYLDQDILPGDTVKINMATVIRQATPLYPTMDNLVADFLWFFIPNRLLWSHWREFWGENSNPWYQTVEYELPHIKTSEMYKFKTKSVADYMGLPVGISGLSVNALPFRAYAKCWSDWFKDENLQQDALNTQSDNDEYTSDYAYQGGNLLKANKLHDYFSSCLPNVQKGPTVKIPMGNLAPVYTSSADNPTSSTGYEPLKWRTTNNSTMQTGNHWVGVGLSSVSNRNIVTRASTDTASPTQTSWANLAPSNLIADLRSITGATITALRQSIAIQHFYEKQSQGGSRYIEFLKNIFGVTSPDARLQRSEYLGGKRISLNIYQVTQQSGTTNTSPLGETGAFGHTADADEYFTKSFTEHGILLGLCVIRYKHSFNQGIERGWSRRKWVDYYLPQFNGLSEMAVLNKELYAQGTSADDEAFGYQENFADYKYKPDVVTSEMRTTYSQSLDAWHYADHYEEQPILGNEWIQENKENVDRTLAVQSEVSDQFIADFYFDATYIRPMPIYNEPGLMRI